MLADLDSHCKMTSVLVLFYNLHNVTNICKRMLNSQTISVFFQCKSIKVSKRDQTIPQSHIADQLTAP